MGSLKLFKLFTPVQFCNLRDKLQCLVHYRLETKSVFSLCFLIITFLIENEKVDIFLVRVWLILIIFLFFYCKKLYCSKFPF